MSESKYIFADSQHSQEIERLQTLETVFDSASRKQILATGITQGWRCLEVGAGAGSIIRWMAEIVGEDGKVIAVDLDTQFIANIELPNVEVLKADIRHVPLERHSFDLIHARHVLIHIPNFQVALSQMLDSLKPGGWIVVEEPDISAAKAVFGNEAVCQSVNRVNQASLQMFANRGIDYALGVKLPAIFQKLGLQLLSIENDTPLSQGGSGIAKVMKMSTVQLADKYVATGKATHQDIEQYCLFAENTNAWAIYPPTVRVTARTTRAAASCQ
ncbi:MAG: class I SAM-dependent methyltransferase [Nostoc indistinguendum CM1-VF10]|nr:class I SAM-dependent methyltransferase [Nostoc indistinguendum CM1-VF10]